MTLLKKVVFAPFFLIIFALLISQLVPVTKSYDFIFSLSSDTLISLLIVAGLIALSSFFFALLVTLAFDFRLVLAVGITASLIPLIFTSPALGIVWVVADFISFLLTFLSLDVSLKSYLSFQPSTLLGPAIRQLSGLLILSFCIIYFFSTSKLIAQNGFQIPDSLIETALKMTPMNTSSQKPAPQLPDISPEQLELLKQNPQVLEQYGLDPKMLDTLSNPSKTSQTPAQLGTDLIKQTVKDQIQGFIKPYLSFIPAILAVLLFLTLQSLTSILNLLVYPLLWLTFLILEKTGFIRFTTEMRPVKKLIV